MIKKHKLRKGVVHLLCLQILDIFLIPTASFIYIFYLIQIISINQVQNQCYIMDFIFD